MIDNNKLPDTEQTVRMKQLALNDNYSNCGEMYRLLNHQELHDLVKKIKKGTIKLKSNLLYGRYEITKEERFLENLDHYITYVKNHYFINSIEQYMLIELSLKTKYANILFEENDYHNDGNFYKYFDNYRKMFFYNFYENLKFYSRWSNKYSYINRLLEDLSKLKFNDAKDMIEIEKILTRVFYVRKDNLYQANIPHKEVEKETYNFYLDQLEWVVRDYYEKYREEPFDLNYDDNYLSVDNSIVLFNICDKVSKLKDDDLVEVEFGIKNKYFNSYRKGKLFRKWELYEVLDIYKKHEKETKYDISFDTIDSTLMFNFWKEAGNSFLDLQFDFLEFSTDHYTLSFGEDDIIKFLKMIKNQIR